MFEGAAEIVMLGITAKGEKFRPSDWAERLCGMMSVFGEDRQLSYSPYLKPVTIQGTPCVVVDNDLQKIDPAAYQFLMGFAQDNELTLRPGRFVRRPEAEGAGGTLRARNKRYTIAFTAAAELRQRLNSCCEAALMTRRFVFVDDVFIGNAVDGAGGTLEHGFGLGFVAGFDSFHHVFDRGAQTRAQAGVVLAALFALARGLARGCSIGHLLNSVAGSTRQAKEHDDTDF